MGFALSGLASGLDSKSLIDQLIAMEGRPIQLLQRKKSLLSTKNHAFQALNTRLLGLKGQANALTTDAKLKAMIATSSDDKIVAVSAGSLAASGSYKVTVNQMATTTRATSNAQVGQSVSDVTSLVANANTVSAITPGKFTLTAVDGAGASTNFQIDVTVDDTWQNVFDRISTNTGGRIIASLSGNNLILTGDTTVTNIKTGAADDTSNFLVQTHLDSATFNTLDKTVRSTQPVGVAQPKAVLNDAKLADGLIAGAGSFKINGIEITWDATIDSLDGILTKINTSAAGVSAAYSGTDDKIVITNKSTGSQNINFQDVTGNLLSSLKVLNTSQETGKDASITIDGLNNNQPILSATNEFKEAISGLVITAKQVGVQQTLNISRDKDVLLKTIRDFVTEFNSTVDAIDAARVKGQPNQNDNDLANIKDRLFSIASNPVAGMIGNPRSLSDLGISTSKDNRNHLEFNETKFVVEFDKNRDRVAEVFQKQGTGDPPTPLGTARILDDYLTKVRGDSGIFKTRQKFTDDQSKAIDDSIKRKERQLEMKRKQLTTKFTQMEVAISKMKSQQATFLGQLGALGGN